MNIDYNYYLELAEKVAEQGTCARRKIGCLLVDEFGAILAEGYNGRPKCLGSCLELPCPGAHVKAGQGAYAKVLCDGVHAEVRALLNFTRMRDPISHIKYIFSTKMPCYSCVLILLETKCQYLIYRTPSNETENKAKWLEAGRFCVEVAREAVKCA